MKNLIQYSIKGVISLIVIWYSFTIMCQSLSSGDLVQTLLWSFLFSANCNLFINKQIEFSKWYPNFEDKWLY